MSHRLFFRSTTETLDRPVHVRRLTSGAVSLDTVSFSSSLPPPTLQLRLPAVSSSKQLASASYSQPKITLFCFEREKEEEK